METDDQKKVIYRKQADQRDWQAIIDIYNQGIDHLWK